MTTKKITKCTGPECDRDAVSDSLCSSHGQQLRLKGVLAKLRPRSPNGTTARSKSKPVKAPESKKLIELEDELRAAVKPTPKKRRGPVHGMREFICPKCQKVMVCLGSEVSHHCFMNKNLNTNFVLVANFKPPVEPNL